MKARTPGAPYHRWLRRSSGRFISDILRARPARRRAGGRGDVKLVIINAPLDVYGIERATVRPVVIAIAALAALVSGLVAGLPSVWQWARTGLSSGERATGDATVSRLCSGLVISPVALAAILLVAAGLTTRSFNRLSSVDPGFDTSSLLTMAYRLPENKYATGAAQTSFHNEVLQRVQSLPGRRALRVDPAISLRES